MRLYYFLCFIILMSCHKKKDPAPVPSSESNTIKILSVSPASNIPSNVVTDFTVEIAYHYVSGDSAEINIGFNSDQFGTFPGNPNNGGYVIYDSHIVYDHTDTVTYVVSGKVINSGAAGSSFSCYANLAKEPHGSIFSPLVDDRKVLTFQ